MAYASQTNEMKAPPPYPPNPAMNFGAPHQHQAFPAGPPLYYNAPPPIPVYIPTVGGFLGHYPQTTNCLSCQQQIVTIVRYEPGGATWLIALLICLFGGFLGCCFIPFCVSSCQDAVHSCPSCGRQIGRRNVF